MSILILNTLCFTKGLAKNLKRWQADLMAMQPSYTSRRRRLPSAVLDYICSRPLTNHDQSAILVTFHIGYLECQR